MKHNYLFPTYFKKVGWILLIPCLALCGYWLSFDFISSERPWKTSVWALISDGEWFCSFQDSVLDEVSLIGLIVSLLFISFSKEKDEDECIARIRGVSLVWALIVAYVIIILGTLFLFSLEYFYFMIFSMLAVLILFCVKFNYAVYQFRKSAGDEE